MLLLAGTALAGMPLFSSAQAETWTGASSTDWFTTGNWSPSTIPTGASTVVIDTVTPNATVINTVSATSGFLTVGQSGTGALTISGGGALSSVSVTAGDLAGSTGTMTVTGSGSTMTTTGVGNQVIIGNYGAGTLLVSSGGAVSDAGGIVGQNAGGTGTATVDGLGSTWTNTSTLTVGTQGTGTLTLSNQGQATTAGVLIGVAGGTGTVSLTGHSGVSTTGAVNVGFTGTGTLTVASNSFVVSSGGAIGNLAGAHGAVTVTGAGSAWSFGAFDLTIGANGTGSLLVSNGGQISSSNGGGTLGQAAGSSGTVTVDGAGSSWTTPAFLFVGVGGAGTMTISNGGVVITNDGTLGVAAGGTGVVTVTGASSTWATTGGINVANAGSGSLAISNGGAVSSVGGTVGALANSTGTVTVTGIGSSWSTGAGNLIIGQYGTGSLLVSNGGAVNDMNGDLGQFAGASGSATVNGTGSIWTNNFLGIGDAGNGTLTISNAGKITNTIGVIGAVAGSVGHVTVDGVGSTWTNSLNLVVGGVGTGSLAISNGATALGGSGIAQIGAGVGGIGAVIVDGSGSSLSNGGGIHVGDAGTGSLSISNGGNVTALSGLFIATQAGSVGTFNIGADAASAAAAPGTLNAPSIAFGLGAGSITFNHTSANYAFAPAISGVGTINQIAGTTILTADSSGFTGATNVTGGRLAVNGSLAGSAVMVSGSGVLGGTGTVGSTTVNGGTLSPGNSIGTLTVQGNLAFASAAHYLVEVSPTAADLTNVTGTATLGGATVNASFAPGSYVVKQYTILNATSGVSGTFGSVVVNTNLPSGFRSSLSYDANNAYLNLDLALQYSGLSINQQNVANSLTNFFNTTGGIPAVFGSLTPAGLTQVSGELATGSQQTTFDAMGLFLGAMTDPTMSRGGEAVGPSAPLQFADETGASSASPTFAMMPGKAPPAASFDRRWSVWGAGFGGSRTTNGDTALGSSGATGRVYGMAAGADYLLLPSTLAGFALAGGGTNFSVSNGGTGHSDLFQAGLFVRHTLGPAYMVAALAYGWQNVTTDRTVSVAGADQLRAKFSANAFSGRLEGGYRFATSSIGITPYAGGQFTTYALPAYAEQAVSGTNTFALTYGAKTATAPRSELGIRADKSYVLTDAILTLRGRVAWAHDFTTGRAIGATFQTLPGASFVVNGAGQAGEAALATASAEVKWIGGLSLAATFEGEFSGVSQSYTSKGVARYAW
ncbi:autotransporter domain-containing protein [Bradyrhizobium sp. SSUT77]|uniref:autotransporter domain-containing protein n=1 Tax=Bradyrhizobium sp. SSUT77 TaxID=3040603 RepID=UPI002446FEF8|nr:autotransporter domain-containing protein [Bradyrhizobium sp. SSUT77]MDH2348942.1 autotransporter domain-containing protein [Bradyrhizobium sp. SSUT77]